MLNKFSRVMFGTKIFMELLKEIASINNLKEFLIIINHDNYNYRIKGIYDTKDLKKINYPKNFRKSIYDIDYLDDIKYYLRAFKKVSKGHLKDFA